jgi:mRNA interferase MazF
MKSYIQGEIYLVNFPFTDGLNSEVRPAIIISNPTVNRSADVIMAQITAEIRNDGYSFELNDTDLIPPLNKRSEIRCHKIFAIQKSKINKKISELNKTKQGELFKKICSLLSVN